jgi:hypothetical protein
MYWMSTVRPDSRPHAAPVWGAWVDGILFLETAPDTIKGRNLAANPSVAVHLEKGEDVVILEGTAEKVTELEPGLFERVADSFAAKYPYRPKDVGGFYVLHPRVGFAWNEFPKSVTRYVFAG